VQPVFDAIVRNAVLLCGNTDGASAVFRYDGTLLHYAAGHALPEWLEAVRLKYPLRPDMSTVSGRAILTMSLARIDDVLADPQYDHAHALKGGWRRMLAVPMLREGVPLGVIVVAWAHPGSTPKSQEDLLRMFADQAVIAIENVRLFNELQARTRELARSVGELRALGEVGRAVSSSLDLENVLTTIVTRALALSGADGGTISEFDETTQQFHLRTTYGVEDELVEVVRAAPILLGEGTSGKAAATRAPVQVADILDEQEYDVARVREVWGRYGYRSALSLPLLREDRILGALTVWRRQVGEFPSEVVNLSRLSPNRPSRFSTPASSASSSTRAGNWSSPASTSPSSSRT
jgi:GAF domain-containing protein